MKQLFTTFYRTITDPSIYRSILKKSLKASFGYFFFFYALISLLVGSYLHLTRSETFINRAYLVLDSIEANYPPDLVVTLEDNRLSTNSATTSATVIPLNEPISGIENVAVIDTTTYAESIENKNTLSLFTDEALTNIISLDPPDFLLVPYSQLNFTGSITHTEVTQTAATIQQALNTMAPYLPLIISLAVFISLGIARLIFVLLYSMLFQFVGQLFSRPFSYQVFLKLSLHTAVLAEILHQLQLHLYPGQIPSFFVIAYIGITLIALFSLPKAFRIKLDNLED